MTSTFNAMQIVLNSNAYHNILSLCDLVIRDEITAKICSRECINRLFELFEITVKKARETLLSGRDCCSDSLAIAANFDKHVANLRRSLNSKREKAFQCLVS